MTDLRPLLARLEEATGPDRELDGDLAHALCLHPAGWRRGIKEASATASWWSRDDSERYDTPDLTSSIDASLALVEKKLPDARDYSIIRLDSGVAVQANIGDEFDDGPTAPLAILICLLRALISNQTDAKDEA